MKALRFASSFTWIAIVSAALSTGSCGGLATTSSGVPDATTEAPPSKGCTTDLACVAALPPTDPPGCAMAACDLRTGACVFTARDEDHDGHAAAACRSTTSVPVIAGDDCNDQDPNLYPGHPEGCSTLEDGGMIMFPLGAPAGICKLGLASCTAGGGVSPCIGAVGPAPRDCASSADNDCDGRPDDTECNCSLVPSPATEPCFPCPRPEKPGAGACASGTETCQPFDMGGMTTWGPCIGYVCATADDTCDPGNDNNCDGIPNDPAGGCSCFDGMVQYCPLEPGCTGVQVCASGRWGACMGTCNPPDAGADVVPVDGGVCTASCKTNLDCAILCGITTVYCCDIETNLCYAPASGMCVVPIPDGGTDTSPY